MALRRSTVRSRHAPPIKATGVRTGLLWAFLAAGSMIGCKSGASLIRATPTGGAYTLDATSSAGVAESARQALEGIAGRCNGVYEITALEKLSQPVRHL